MALEAERAVDAAAAAGSDSADSDSAEAEAEATAAASMVWWSGALNDMSRSTIQEQSGKMMIMASRTTNYIKSKWLASEIWIPYAQCCGLS